MTGAALPQGVQRFLLTHIDSIEKLEILLLLRARRERAWTAPEVARELRITEASASARLAELSAERLLLQEEAPAACRYSPASNDSARAVEELAVAYAERRVSVISFIFSRPLERVRVFADAFLLKQDWDKEPH